MGVPFEALLPYGIMVSMFAVTGAGMSWLRHWQNGGKRGRHSIDQWDRQSTKTPLPSPTSWADPSVVMERDRRLTGSLRGQSDSPYAPEGFELNNPWKVEKRFL